MAPYDIPGISLMPVPVEPPQYPLIGTGVVGLDERGPQIILPKDLCKRATIIHVSLGTRRERTRNARNLLSRHLLVESA